MVPGGKDTAAAVALTALAAREPLLVAFGVPPLFARLRAAGTASAVAGIFVGGAGAVLGELRRHAPDVPVPLDEAYPGRLAEACPRVPRISVGYALLERTARPAVVPASFAWDDLGDWTALERVLRGGSPNAVVGRHVGIYTRGAILCTTGDDLIVAAGLEDVVIVRDGEVTLIARKDRVQESKQGPAGLRAGPAPSGSTRAWPPWAGTRPPSIRSQGRGSGSDARWSLHLSRREPTGKIAC